MKTKAKLMLGISVMTAAVLAAGVTSTFAWLTTQSKATLTTGNMTVSTVSNITIDITKLGYDTDESEATGFDGPTNIATDVNQPLGTVSSINGMNFYAPKALNDSGTYNASELDEVTTKADWEGEPKKYGNGYVGYMKYGIRVQAAQEPGNGRTLNYKITPTVTEGTGTDLTAAYRVALLNATYDGTWTAGAAMGLYSNAAGTKDGWGTGPAKTTYTTTAISTVASPVQVTGVTTQNAIDKYYIFSVWVEGEDPKAINDKISGAKLKVALEFSLV